MWLIYAVLSQERCVRMYYADLKVGAVKAKTTPTYQPGEIFRTRSESYILVLRRYYGGHREERIDVFNITSNRVRYGFRITGMSGDNKKIV